MTSNAASERPGDWIVKQTSGYPESEPSGQITTVSYELVARTWFRCIFLRFLNQGNDKLGHRMRCCLYFSAMKTGSETSQKSALSTARSEVEMFDSTHAYDRHSRCSARAAIAPTLNIPAARNS